MFNDENETNAPSIMPIFTEITGGGIDTACEGLNTEDLPILALRNMVLYPADWNICHRRQGEIAETRSRSPEEPLIYRRKLPDRQ